MTARGIILLEGADSSGKTTLANYFVEKYGARYVHSTVRRDVWRWHVAALRRATKLAETGLVVMDRLWHSELAYGAVYRGGPAYDLGARCLDRVLQKHGALTILCAPSNLKRQLKRHEEGRKVKNLARGRDAGHAPAPEHFANIERVVALYADLARGNVAHAGDGYLDQLIRFGDYVGRSDVLRYDLDAWDRRSLGRFARTALLRLDLLRSVQYEPALAAGRCNFAGSLNQARTLFVGEAVSPKYDGTRWPRWPFVWSDEMSAATYLNRALHALAFDETRATWTNALEVDDHLPDLLQLQPGSPALRVVTLGSEAARRVRELGYRPDAELPHPQYWRRFHHRDFDGYVKLLEEAIKL